MITLKRLNEILNDYHQLPKKSFSEFIITPPLIRHLQMFIHSLEKIDRYNNLSLTQQDVFQLITITDIFDDRIQCNEQIIATLRQEIAATFNAAFTNEILQILLLIRQHNLLNETSYQRLLEMTQDSDSYLDVLWQCIIKLNTKHLFTASNYQALTNHYDFISGIYSIYSLLDEVGKQHRHYPQLNQKNIEIIFEQVAIFNDFRMRWVLDHFKANAAVFTNDVFNKIIEHCHEANVTHDTKVSTICHYLSKLIGIDDLYHTNFEVFANTAMIMQGLQEHIVYPAYHLYYKPSSHPKSTLANEPPKTLPPLANYCLYLSQTSNTVTENVTEPLDKMRLGM